MFLLLFLLLWWWLWLRLLLRLQLLVLVLVAGVVVVVVAAGVVVLVQNLWPMAACTPVSAWLESQSLISLAEVVDWRRALARAAPVCGKV